MMAINAVQIKKYKRGPLSLLKSSAQRNESIGEFKAIWTNSEHK